ncbi:hypothetical protein JCM11491_002599 [Sporobolomyces phaffii]
MDARMRGGPESPDYATDGSEEDLWDDDGDLTASRELQRDARKRHVMLACACLLGLGSHFGAYVLGPIKSSLKTSESAFASLIASFELLNTVTPLLSGFLVPKFGAARVGLFATGIVLCGQIVVCASQGADMDMAGTVSPTICGLLLFGGGISPVSVVQETIILSNNTSSSRSVGRSVALGLVLGKTSSFIAGASSDWLHSISPRMPFVAATVFAGISFAAAIIYAKTEQSLVRSPHSIVHPAAHKHSPINLTSYAKFGDPFWLYIAICFFAGAWYTTIHLSTNLLQAVYDIGQRSASEAASILLLSPTLLYPLAGWALDKRPHLMSSLHIAVPIGLASSISILLFLSSVVPYALALVGAALSCGIGPLLSVLVVPRIVTVERASAALALHKSLEMSGGILFQTVAGVLLSLSTTITPIDSNLPHQPTTTHEDPDSTLFFILGASLAQLGVVSGFWGLMRRRGLDPPSSVEATGEEGRSRQREREASLRMRVSTERLRRSGDGEAGEYGLLRETTRELSPDPVSAVEREDSEDDDGEEGALGELATAERRRGEKCLAAAVCTIFASWEEETPESSWVSEEKDYMMQHLVLEVTPSSGST